MLGRIENNTPKDIGKQNPTETIPNAVTAGVLISSTHAFALDNCHLGFTPSIPVHSRSLSQATNIFINVILTKWCIDDQKPLGKVR